MKERSSVEDEGDVERQLVEKVRKLETVSEWPGKARSLESVDLE